jgi:NADH:ubiquinone oxidoreductase subunit E
MEVFMIITVCIGSSCHIKGSRKVVEELQNLIQAYKVNNEVELKGSFCMGNCVKGVSVQIENEIFSLSPENTLDFFKEKVIGRLKG